MWTIWQHPNTTAPRCEHLESDAGWSLEVLSVLYFDLPGTFRKHAGNTKVTKPRNGTKLWTKFASNISEKVLHLFSRIHRQSIILFFQWPKPTQLLRNTHLHICHHLAMPGGSSFRSMGNVSRTRLWLPKGAHYAWGISKSFVLDQHIDIPIFSPQGGTHRPEDTLRLFSYVPSKKRNENILITIAFQGASPWLRNARSGSTSAGLVVKLRSSPANSSTSWEVIGWCKWHEKHRIYRSNLYIYVSNITHTPNILYKSCVET